MAESSEKKPTEAIDEPRLPSNEIGETSDADMALAAMGYKPVRPVTLFTPPCGSAALPSCRIP